MSDDHIPELELLPIEPIDEIESADAENIPPLPPPKPEDPNIGKVLKQTYTLTKKVGEGGMGSVYLANQAPLNRQVAIKILKPNESNPEGEHYFMREVQAINMLRHPNIIQIVDFGKEGDGSLYLVMEFLPGKTLQRVIRKEFPVPQSRICEISPQILSALQAAHEKEIVHCDLKPANIMLERVAGQEDFVKVLDFGIAKVKGPAMEVGPYTQAGNIVGTFDYMSPEQIMRKDLDGRADLWSLGVIIYEMLTKKRIFHDTDAVSIIGRVMQMPIIPPEEVLGQGNVHPELNRIVMTALQRNVTKRFQSAEAMRKALTRLARGLESGSYDVSSPNTGNTGGHTGNLGHTGSHSGPLTGQSGSLLRRSNQTSNTSIASRSGSFASTEMSARMATGIAAGTSILDQTFSIDALQDSLMGERRKVATLSIQQRSRRSKGIDPEELAMRSAQEARIIRDVVALYDGEVDSFLGGTFTILFGAQKARVGDHLRAVECAFALQERFKLLEQGSAHLGIGLAYGEVFLSSKTGGNAFGASIDRAVEIARNATKAQILVDDALIALTRQQVKYDSSQQIAGEPVAAVLSINKSDDQTQQQEAAVLQNVDVYIPRPGYFEELVRRANAAKDGHGGGVAMVGQVGAGKTVLLEHFCENRTKNGWQSFHVGPEDVTENQLLSPIRVWIRQIAATYKDPGMLIQKACESIGLRSNVGEVVRLYVQDNDASINPAGLPWQDQNGYLHFTAALFHRMVRFAMKKGPVMLSVDNIDTSDVLSMDFVDSFISQSQKMAVLLLTTKRIDREVYEHGLPENFEIMTIDGFEPNESRQYVSQLIGYTPSQNVIVQLHERASGNPMFLKEMLRALIKRGGLESLDEQGIMQAGIPLNLHELLAERVDELPQNLRDLLAIASVMGESFREEFFYQIVPSHLMPERGLKDLLDTNLFEAKEDSFGRVVVAFNPRTLRTVVYERLPKQSRIQIHKSIVEFLENAPNLAAIDSIDLPMMLAFHYRSMEEPWVAAKHLTHVGEMLLDLYDYEGAISYHSDALELLKDAEAAHPTKLFASIKLLTAYRESGRVDDAQTLIDRLPEIEQIPPEMHGEVWLEIGQVGMEAGRLERSMKALFKVVEIATAAGQTKQEVKALLALAQLFEKENQLQRAASLLVDVSKKVEQIGDLDMSQPDDRRLMWTAYNQLGTLFIRQKDIQNAQQYLQLALQKAQHIQDHRGLVRILSNLGALFLTVRDMTNAQKFFNNALEMAKATGDLLNQSRILTNMGIVAFEMGDLEFSQKYFKQARGIAEEIGWYEGLADLSQHIKRLRQSLRK